MAGVTRGRIVESLRGLGLGAGDIVMVHSSLRSIGYVEGGAEAVVDALLEVLGPGGTLVVPTFIFSRGGLMSGSEQELIFDSANDPSEMGAISEAARRRPGAHRTRHHIHSMAAVGAQGEEITRVQGVSAWAGDGPFWQLYFRDAKVLMLGVPYLRCTFFHVVEQLVVTPYRQWREVRGQEREADGTLRPMVNWMFSPRQPFVGNDFNKFGRMLEERGLARVGAVGNAVARLFRARDIIDVGVAEYRRDPGLFLKDGDGYVALADGVLTEELHNEKAVLDPQAIYRSTG